MERRISPGEYIRLMILGLLVSGSIFAIAFFLIACGDSEQPTPILVPEIISFNPASGFNGHQVIISGFNFNKEPIRNVVKFNGIDASLFSASPTELVTSVPFGATTGRITVTIGAQTATSRDEFVVLVVPTITSFTPASGLPPLSTGFAGETITITGTNFSTTPTDNIVKFNSVAAVVSASTKTQLTVNVPAGATTGKIFVSVNGIPAETVTDFIVLTTNTWSTKADFGGDGRRSAAGFVIGDMIYIGTGQVTDNSNRKDFWEYNTLTNVWTQKADVGGSVRNSASGFSIGSKGYIGLGYNSGSSMKDFWEYNPATNQWNQKADFAGEARSLATSFTLGSKGYIARGINANNMNDLWEYDPTENNWTKKADVGGAVRSNCAGAVINGKAYIGPGQGSAVQDFWEYNPTTNQWVQKADFPSANGSTAAFGIGSKGYFVPNASTDLWQYDPVTNQWTKKAGFTGTLRSYGIGLAKGNVGYFGLGTTTVAVKSFYQYIPE